MLNKSVDSIPLLSAVTLHVTCLDGIDFSHHGPVQNRTVEGLLSDCSRVVHLLYTQSKTMIDMSR